MFVNINFVYAVDAMTNSVYIELLGGVEGAGGGGGRHFISRCHVRSIHCILYKTAVQCAVQYTMYIIHT